MPSYCVVPNCKSNKVKSGYKRLSTFKVPSNETLREKWLQSIPALKYLKSSDRVCEQHFEKKFIIKEFVKYDNSGNEIARKFFGIIRGAAGSNEQPTCPSFLSLYKLLSVYSIIKPPLYGNCTVIKNKCENIITITDLKQIYEKSVTRTSTVLADLKLKIDNIIKYEDWEADDVIEHDYTLSPVLDCIIYYVTGYLCKQVLKSDKYSKCNVCKAALLTSNELQSSITQLVDLKTRGSLIHANRRFFNWINFVEKSFAKFSSNSEVFYLTVDEVLNNYEFKFPCKVHGPDILSYAIFYYVRLRMRQFTFQHNKKFKKQTALLRKNSKLCDT